MATRASARYEIKAVDKTKQAFRRIGKSLSAMKDQAKRATIAIAAVGAAGAIAVGALAKKALQSAAGLKQLSTQTGIATKDLQELEALFARIGMQDRAAETIKDVWEALGEAKREPGGEKGKAFEKLGIEPAKIKKVMQLFQQFSRAYAKAAKAGEQDKFLFDVREISNEAGDAIAAIGGNFKALRAASKGTIFSEETIERASKTMREWRTLIFEITKKLQDGLLNSSLMKGFQEAMTRVSNTLGKEGIVGALADVLNILMEKFPAATTLVFDAFAELKQLWKDILATIKEVEIILGGIGAGGKAIAEFATEGVKSRSGVGGMIPVDPAAQGRVERYLKGIFDNTRTITGTAG